MRQFVWVNTPEYAKWMQLAVVHPDALEASNHVYIEAHKTLV